MTESGPARIADTPAPPYVAVIFTSLRTEDDELGYATMSAAMDALAARQPGYLGVESAREGIGITVSYWRDDAAARAWKQVGAHLVAQRRGQLIWYRDYRVRIATVHRDYGADDSGPDDSGPNDNGVDDSASDNNASDNNASDNNGPDDNGD